MANRGSTRRERMPDDRDYDQPSRKHPNREPAAGSSRRPALNEYFIDSEGIDRQVLQSEICKWLGPEATCRPGEYNGRVGYKIKAVRPFTPDMLDDLKALSLKYVEENSRQREDVPYSQSATRKLFNQEVERYNSGPGYIQNAPFPHDGPPPNFNPQMYPPGPSYSGGPYTMPPPNPMGAPTAGGDPRYGGGSNYVYGAPPPNYPQGGYQPGNGDYNSIPRNREGPGFFPPGGPPHDPGRPDFYNAPMSMGGPSREYDMGPSGRMQGGSPMYEPSRDGSYMSRQPPQEQYAPRGGHRPR